VQPGEQCDGADLQGFDCVSLGLGPGVLTCDPIACTFDVSMCGPGVGNCGDGIIQPGEQCDGADLQGFDCASLGLGGGVLACDPITCTFDTSMCMPAGGTSG
jgi:cysteine-rich repeat protein